MDEMFDAVGEALCCAAAIRVGGAVRVLTERAGVLEHYDTIMAGIESTTGFLDGRELDDELVVAAFAESWSLDSRCPAGFAGHTVVKGWASLAFGVTALTRPKQGDTSAAQWLECASHAAAAWPSGVRVDSYDSLAHFELACQQEAADRLRKDGLPALWELADVRSKQYHQVAEELRG
ncbi:hypothetical protein [Streptomyces bauhiniae]|uniref:Uncharacterized protein n=1 Tax=Streptomyces bauhiniae TaxID=2340725 RepID=A0A7K3QL17_9ACTN|nr:hypothetical protein [Streptomyces bauhiniae]NEB90575.1 hypothetical protein [Streptomyces bauhiniae]